MTTVRPARPTWRTALTSRAFAVHYLQMLLAMLAGMIVLGPLSMLLAGDSAPDEVHALLMVLSMTAGMAAWMAWRRHAWPRIVEMGLAMTGSFVVLFPLLWLDMLSSDGLMIAGHVLMLPAMALAMVYRREAYLCTVGHP